MERYTPLVTFWIWLTLLETNTLHTSPQVQHTTVKIISIQYTTTLTQVQFPHSEIVIEKGIKQLIIHCWIKH